MRGSQSYYASPVYQIKISSYPNGESRLVFSTCGGRAKKNSSSLVSPSAELGEELEDGSALPSSVMSVPIDLTLALNSMAPPAPKVTRSKSGRFTLEAKRKILRAGGALDVFDVKPQNCLFLTGTLPGSTKEAMNEIPKHSGYIVNRLKMWIRERYKENQFSFYCWELQKRGALHLHYCVYCPDAVASRYIVSHFRLFWIRLLQQLCDLSGVDLFAKSYGGSHRHHTNNVQANAQWCRKSVASYMAKYCCKEAGRGHPSRYPARWTGVSRPLSALIKELTQEVVAVTPSYRQGRTLYEDARQYLTGTPKGCYTYPHKVGIGETRIAYYSSDKELQSCQFHHASNRLSSTVSCQQSSLVMQETIPVRSLLTEMSMIVRQVYGSLHSSSISSSVGLRGILPRLLEELNTASLQAKSLRILKREMTAMITSSLSIPCAKFLSLVQDSCREPLRNIVRSLWHLADGSLGIPDLEKRLRIVSNLLTKQVENEYGSTTDCETSCDAEGDAKQLALYF